MGEAHHIIPHHLATAHMIRPLVTLETQFEYTDTSADKRDTRATVEQPGGSQ